MSKQSKEYFPSISKIQYEGPTSKNPLAFKHYNPQELVEGKSMKEHLRFSVTYWHTIRGQLSDMFGAGTAVRQDGRDAGARRVRVPAEARRAVLCLS
jgi:xylose isomerase